MSKAMLALCFALALVEASRVGASRMVSKNLYANVHQSSLARESSALNTNSSLTLHGPGAVLDPETELMIRACIGDRAKDWVALHERLGLEVPGDSNVDPVESVREIFHIEDLIAQRANSRSKLQQWLHWSHFSSNMKKWKEQKKKATEALLSTDFNLDASRKRCAKGSTNQAYRCMLEKACPEGDDECALVRHKVHERIDMKDLVVHLQTQRGWFGSMEQKEDDLWSKIASLDSDLKRLNYTWTETKESCRKLLKEEVGRIQNRTLSELSAAEEIQENCQEAPGKMCPEGTYATVKRRWDAAKGAAVAGGAYLVAKFTLLPLGSTIGAGIGGVAGGTAGAIAANAMVGPIAMVAGWWASRGPLECACFPRECIFSNTTNTCQLDLHNTTSQNPYSSALPMSGMKCAFAYKSEETCSLQPCMEVDYSGDIANGTSFGTVGPQKNGIHNCLSSNGFSKGTFAVLTDLPNGQANTVKNRNAIYDDLLEPPESPL